MSLRPDLLATAALVALLVVPCQSGRAAEEKPGQKSVSLFNGQSQSGWSLKGDRAKSHWQVGVPTLDENNPQALAVKSGSPDLSALVNAQGGGVDLFTDKKFGDGTYTVEFMVPKGSNSGIYLMGEYEVQVFDSYGKKEIGPADLGSLYSAAVAKVNAAKKPGEWQTFEIDFRAPRFDGEKKTANAKFVKVVLNGQTIHENVELKGPTPGGLTGKEAPAGPLMFQGDHGPVAFRQIKFKPAK